mmetsp:Transcript_35079/g.92606  ORF Transcript_35079/g.92606 Transcript_35079/m.92606 type:complete len:219 (+) Transcript_35079:208-864(+)
MSICSNFFSCEHGDEISRQGVKACRLNDREAACLRLTVVLSHHFELPVGLAGDVHIVCASGEAGFDEIFSIVQLVWASICKHHLGSACHRLQGFQILEVSHKSCDCRLGSDASKLRSQVHEINLAAATNRPSWGPRKAHRQIPGSQPTRKASSPIDDQIKFPVALQGWTACTATRLLAHACFLNHLWKLHALGQPEADRKRTQKICLHGDMATVWYQM